VSGVYVIQPTLVGGSTRLPFLWALVGTLGGVETFGLVGLFVGPVIMAAVLSLMREWLAQKAQLLFPLVLGRNFACVSPLSRCYCRSCWLGVYPSAVAIRSPPKATPPSRCHHRRPPSEIR
jgi:hypothetical protein